MHYKSKVKQHQQDWEQTELPLGELPAALMGAPLSELAGAWPQPRGFLWPWASPGSQEVSGNLASWLVEVA